MNNALVHLFSLYTRLPTSQRIRILSKILIKHTNMFNFKIRAYIFVLRLLYNDAKVLIRLQNYLLKHPVETEYYNTIVIFEINMYENCKIMQDIIVSLHEENWVPELLCDINIFKLSNINNKKE